MSDSWRPFRCPLHDFLIEDKGGDGCPSCIEEMAGPVPNSPQERADEVVLRVRDTPLTTRFKFLWERVDRLVGRGTFNHELVNPEQLAAEILGADRIPPLESLKALVGDKPILVVTSDEGGPDG